MMSPAEMERVLRDVDVRTSTIERILPTLATKVDLDRFATKEDLQRFATKEDLQRFATKEDLQRFATKEDLERFATKEDLARYAARAEERFATKDDLTEAVTMLRAEIQESRRYALVLHEDVKADIRILAEHLARVLERLDRER